MTAVLIVVSIVALGEFVVVARRLLDPRFGLTWLLLAGVLGLTVAGLIAHNTLIPLITRSSTTLYIQPMAGEAHGRKLHYAHPGNHRT